MRVSLLICAVAWMAAVNGPAVADCLEDVEALELAALQGEGEPAIDDPSSTPAEKGRASMPRPVRDHLREAEAAARHGDEIQCFSMYQTALRLLSGF
jgi:hypothetical protein